MNIKRKFRNTETTTNPLNDPSIFSSAYQLVVHDNKWQIRYYDTSGNVQYIDINSVFSITDFPNKDISSLYSSDHLTSPQTWNYNLALIDNRISAIRKELTYWDLYHLTAQVNEPLLLDSTFNNLSVGQSLVINTNENFENNGEEYHRGDVVVKLLDNTAAKIDALSSGVYQPDEHSPSNTIVYNYIPGTPSVDQQKVIITLSEDPIADSFIYGIYKPLNTTYFTENFSTYNGNVIYPHIKLFHKDRYNVLEEIICDYTYTPQGTTSFTVDNIPSIVNWYQIK